MVEGRSFTLYTDHQSLIPALHKKTEPQTARHTYQLANIAEYTTDIRYLEGKANSVADALSRPHTPVARALIASITELETWCNQVTLVNSVSSVTRPIATPTSARQSAPGASPSPAGPTVAGFSEDGQASSQGSSSTQQPQTDSAGPSSKAATPISSVDRTVPVPKLEELSRVVASIEPLGLDLVTMAQEQPLDPDLVRLSQDPNCGLSFRRVDLGTTSILVDISNGPARPFVPYSWRRRVFDAIHNLGHPGVERTRQTLAQKFVWPSLRRDASKWARECLDCSRAKISRHTVPPIGEFIVPSRRFSHLHADITTVPASNGFPYLLTIVDRFTRWPQAIPLRDITAESVVDGFAHGWFASFGIPRAITTDQGSQFLSNTWSQLMQVWGVEHHTTTAYHPEANGLVERFHRRLKESLKALCRDERDRWFWRLPCALLSIRTALKPDVGASPADLVYGEGLALPGELLGNHPQEDASLQQQRRELLGNLRLEVDRLQPAATSAHRNPAVFIPKDLAGCTHVFILRGGVLPTLTAPYAAQCG